VTDARAAGAAGAKEARTSRRGVRKCWGAHAAPSTEAARLLRPQPPAVIPPHTAAPPPETHLAYTLLGARVVK